MKYTIKIGYKEKTQNNIDARRPFFGGPSSTEKIIIYRSFLQLYQCLTDFDGTALTALTALTAFDEVYGIYLQQGSTIRTGFECVYIKKIFFTI